MAIFRFLNIDSTYFEEMAVKLFCRSLICKLEIVTLEFHQVVIWIESLA